MYEDFIVQDESYDYIVEAKKLLQNGFYANSHGDLMPLPMATLLQASLIIITTHTSSNSHVCIKLQSLVQRTLQ